MLLVNKTYTLAGGVDYSAAGGMKAELGDILLVMSYSQIKMKRQLISLSMGPSCLNEAESQAKANKLISIAGDRKDCMAVISPHRGRVVDVTNAATQTSNVIDSLVLYHLHLMLYLIVVISILMIDLIIPLVMFQPTVTLLD